MNWRPVAATPKGAALFSSLTTGRAEGLQKARNADPEVLHKGFGLATAGSPGFLEGAILDWRAGSPNAA